MADDYVQEDFFAVLDAAESAKRRDEALVKVDAATSDAWREEARQAVTHLAKTRESFTIDDFWTIVLKPVQAKRAGPVLRWAVDQKLIEDSGHHVRTAQVTRNSSPIIVWRSLLWTGA